MAPLPDPTTARAPHLLAVASPTADLDQFAREAGQVGQQHLQIRMKSAHVFLRCVAVFVRTASRVAA